jgi:hypothetical protein
MMGGELHPHCEQRMKSQKTVLGIQDGTNLNYNDLAECEGLGVIGSTSREPRAEACTSTPVWP